jgi:hypothetical protein
MAALLPGDTPWRAVIAWADRRGLSADEAEFLVEMIRVIDAEYLTAQQRKAKARG